MRIRHFILPFLVLLLLSTSEYAQASRVNNNQALLDFSDTTAYCYVYIRADSARSDISATIELWNGSRLIGSWEESAKSSITFSKDVSVEKGKTYQLTVDYTIDGEPQNALSASGTC